MAPVWILALAALLAREPKTTERELHAEAIAYGDGDVVLEGWLVHEKGLAAKRPGVILVHEWKGHGAYVRERAEQVARLGYVAFAIDMYGKGVFAKDHEEAGKLAGAFLKDRTMMRRRAAAGLERFKQVPVVDSSKIAAMGYCFGGTTVLELARAGVDLRAVASFHGNLGTPSPAAAGGVKARVAVFHGSADPHVPASQLEGFTDEMNKAGADWLLVSFGRALHSFTVKEAKSPEFGLAYDATADRRSWEMLKAFLAESLD